MGERAILIAGPTASGKSALALKFAGNARQQGRMPVIVNADSMQVYREMRIISARPSAEEEALEQHLLYGFVPVQEAFNTGRWLEEMRIVLDKLNDDHLPIIVGGTGLYFKALTEGFAEIPEVPDEVRERFRYELHERGPAKMHALLRRVDAASAMELKPSDGQRILRALEVKEVTGKSLVWWQKQAQAKPLLQGGDCRKFIALPDRATLYERINQRFDHMVAEGALEEVAAIRELALDDALPAMKAIGVPQFIRYLNGGCDMADAIDSAKQESRRYAKRQMTWFRNQMSDDWQVLDDPGAVDLRL